jgi:hypothetical protein
MINLDFFDVFVVQEVKSWQPRKAHFPTSLKYFFGFSIVAAQNEETDL